MTLQNQFAISLHHRMKIRITVHLIWLGFDHWNHWSMIWWKNIHISWPWEVLRPKVSEWSNAWLTSLVLEWHDLQRLGSCFIKEVIWQHSATSLNNTDSALFSSLYNETFSDSGVRLNNIRQPMHQRSWQSSSPTAIHLKTPCTHCQQNPDKSFIPFYTYMQNISRTGQKFWCLSKLTFWPVDFILNTTTYPTCRLFHKLQQFQGDSCLKSLSFFTIPELLGSETNLEPL